jgi:hypothetical protein
MNSTHLLRLGPACLILVACHFDRLTNQPPPPIPPIPDLAPLIDSATVGANAPRIEHLALRILGGGKIQWVAHVKNRASWLALSDSSGFAPDTLDVIADPTGLGVGTYRDTIVIATSINPAILALPVEFRIVP